MLRAWACPRKTAGALTAARNGRRVRHPSCVGANPYVPDPRAAATTAVETGDTLVRCERVQVGDRLVDFLGPVTGAEPPEPGVFTIAGTVALVLAIGAIFLAWAMCAMYLSLRSRHGGFGITSASVQPSTIAATVSPNSARIRASVGWPPASSTAS